jgi:YidC/Oxa1 family membrane protein insertase
MEFLFNMPLVTPALGFIMRLCYALVGNVGVAIIVFTVLIRFAMFPISVKQQKNTSKTQLFAPRVREIQTKYRGNTAKMQEELGKLQKEGYNPMAGCLPMALTMLILFGVLGVVYKPMTYFENVNAGQDTDQVAIVSDVAVDIIREIEYIAIMERYIEANDGVESYEDIPAEVREVARNEVNTIELRTERSSRGGRHIQHELLVLRVYRDNEATFRTDTRITEVTHERLSGLMKSIRLGGIDFSENPTYDWPMILIPILAFLFAAGQTIIMQYVQKKTSPESVAQMGAMRYLLYFIPFMSLFIAFSFPAGAGFYWAISAAAGIVQSLVIYKIWPPAKLRAEVEETLSKQGADNVVVIEKHDGRKVEKKISEMSGKEEKEYYRKKLEAARQADLDKYGALTELSEGENE